VFASSARVVAYVAQTDEGPLRRVCCAITSIDGTYRLSNLSNTHTHTHTHTHTNSGIENERDEIMFGKRSSRLLLCFTRIFVVHARVDQQHINNALVHQLKQSCVNNDFFRRYLLVSRYLVDDVRVVAAQVRHRTQQIAFHCRERTNKRQTSTIFSRKNRTIISRQPSNDVACARSTISTTRIRSNDRIIFWPSITKTTNKTK
jgi:hypothetical protein